MASANFIKRFTEEILTKERFHVAESLVESNFDDAIATKDRAQIASASSLRDLMFKAKAEVAGQAE